MQKRLSANANRIIPILLVLFSVASFLLGFYTGRGQSHFEAQMIALLMNAPIPSECVLCDGASYHGPCIVNTSTGQVIEMSVYEMDRVNSNEIAEEQDTGILRIAHQGQLAIWSDPGMQWARCEIPSDTDIMCPNFFCERCRILLAMQAIDGYVLADLKDPESIKIYSIKDGARYEIRDYTVTIEQRKGLKGLSIEVLGHYFI